MKLKVKHQIDGRWIWGTMVMKNLKVKRHGPGDYHVTDGTNVVQVYKHEQRWTAAALWDRTLQSPYGRFRFSEAKRDAVKMLESKTPEFA